MPFFYNSPTRVKSVSSFDHLYILIDDCSENGDYEFNFDDFKHYYNCDNYSNYSICKNK